MKLIFSLISLVLLTSGVLGQTQATPQPSPTPNPESLDWCSAEPAYEAMLRETRWKNANDLFQILIAVNARVGVTPEQRANIRNVLFAMADGQRKPDAELLNIVTDDFAEGAVLRKLTTKLKAGLAINMQSAMAGVNDDYMPNVSSALAFINGVFEDAGMSRKRARKIVDDVYALVAKARRQ